MNNMKNEKYFIALYNDGKTNAELAKLFKINVRTVSKWLAQLRTENKIKRRSEMTIFKEKSTEVSPKKYEVHYTGMITELRNHINSVEPLKVVKSTKKHKGDTLIVQFSDWHVGRKIIDEYGNILYNEAVFEVRVQSLIYEMITLLDRYIKRGTPIRDVVIISTGDILDGQGIFSTQETLSELSPPFQVMKGVHAIQKFILALLERKLEVYFYGVKGNHGEIRVNGRNRDPNANWDLMLYLILDFWSKTILKTKAVHINYSELDYINFKIQGWKYHARHIAPMQSETAGGKAKFLGWAKRHEFDALVYGHYHHWGVWDRSKVTVFRGGSLTGADEFAETLAEESDPIQMMWGCNEKRPLTFFYPVDLGKKEKKKD